MAKQQQDEIDWQIEGQETGDDLTSEELADLEREASGDDRDDAEPGREAEAKREGEPAGGEVEDIEESRDRLRRLDLERANRSLRREIRTLRAERRMHRLESEVKPEAKRVELPDQIVFEVDDAGRVSLPKEKWMEYVAAAETRRVDPAEALRNARRAQNTAREVYEEIKSDYIDGSDDPELAEDTIDQLEGAYRWLSRQIAGELRAGHPPPQSQDELLDMLEDAGITEDFGARYRGLEPRELLEASANERKFARLVDREMDTAGERDRPRRESREDYDEDEDRELRRHRVAQRSRPPRRRGLRAAPRRSMRRRGASGVRPEANPTLDRYASMDMEDFLDLPIAEIDKVSRLASVPPRRRRR